jgi:CelD/BcsL family acetyltransferase involved in cellulose biosynthesis
VSERPDPARRQVSSDVARSDLDRCDLVRRVPLSRVDQPTVDAWRKLQAQSALKSPLTSYEFAHLADDAWGDVEVILGEHRSETVFVLPVHLRANRFARPVGGAFSDVHGPLAADGFAGRVRDILRRAGVSAYRFSGLDDSAGAFADSVASCDTSLAIVLDQPAEAYLAACRAANVKRIKNYQRLETKLAREHGELKLIAPDRSEQHFERLLDWKREQLDRTGYFDFLEAAPNRRLLDLARHAGGQGLTGLHLTLMLNDRPIAGHFGVRLGAHYHPWIAAYDPEFSDFSPGIILISRAILAMPALGLTHYELGVGHAHYKKFYANVERPVASGVVFGGGVSAMAEWAGEAVGRGLEALPSRRLARAMTRLRRRTEQIAASETHFTRRAAAMADALVRRSFRPETLDLVHAEPAHGE